MTNDDKMTVTFTAKELFHEIQASLKEIIGILGQKADQAEVVKLEVRVTAVEGALENIALVASTLKDDKKSRLTGKQKVFVWITVSITTVLNVLALGPDVIHRWAG